jgi:hydrophobe/amphiphile efflux-3 (HAE3) family protein
MRRISEALARFIERWPWLFIVVAVLLSAAAAPGITMLKTDTGFDALVSSEAKIAKDNTRYQAQFGGESITVLLSGQLEDIFSAGNRDILARFEQQFSHDERYRAINSPLMLLQTAVTEANQQKQKLQQQIAIAQEEAMAKAKQAAAAAGLSELQQEQAAEQAKAAVLQKIQPQLEQMQSIGEISLDNPAFIKSVLYDDSGAISQLMRPLIPDDRHALIIVTPQGNMGDKEALQATRDIEGFFSANPLDKVTATVVSSAKLVDAISVSMSNNIIMMLGLSVLVMIIILMVTFRVRWRLLSLLMVGISCLWTFGLMGYISVPLTMATMAILPILIGLGIDYSIQFHNRYQEELTRSNTIAEALITSVSRMLPVVGVALLATIIGFITLYISKVPMIQDFGKMLAIGIVISYLGGLFLLNSVVYLADKRTPMERLKKASKEASGRIERVLSRIGTMAINHTLWIFIVAVIFAIGGGIVDHWLPTNTDYEDLMPQNTPALVELRQLRDIAGTGGSIRFMVEADEDLTSPLILNWLNNFQDKALSEHPQLISANSLATLATRASGGTIPSQQQIDKILADTPPLYVAQVLSSDHRMASVSFSIRHMPLDETHNLLQRMQEEASPPAGVRVSPVGTLALGGSTIDAVVGSRLTMNFICLGATLLILLLIYRRLSNTIFTLIPVGAVMAWSSLDMYLIGIPLNPLTAIMGVLIIGIGTEFMVLLMGRYHEEKRLGLLPRDAMITAISRIGRAIVATALTTLGGFGVLIASNFVMVRDFGIATVFGVFLCLVITLAVMPGVIVWYDDWRSKRLAGR